VRWSGAAHAPADAGGIDAPESTRRGARMHVRGHAAARIDASRLRSYARPAAASLVDRHADHMEQPEERPVSPSDFVFLACGLALGLLAGGALIEVFRARPAARREVRVTISAAPAGGRAATLATPLLGSELAHGRDDIFAPEARPIERQFGLGTREPVREPVAAFRPTAALAPAFGTGPGTAQAEPVDPCATQRGAAEDACAHADRVAAVAGAAQERLHNALRAYDEHVGRRNRAAASVDPGAIRAAKDEAQAQFRRGRLAARDRAAIEAAAAAWLREINRINARSRESAPVMSREAAVEVELLRAVEKAGLDADVARIRSEQAAEVCRAARMALATCEEAERLGSAAPEPVAPATPRELGPEGDAATELPAAAGQDVAILRLLRGDRATMRSIVERLGGSDPDEQRRWQLLVSDLVDAIVARAIDASALSFPTDHILWGLYTQLQCREIASALAALGYRFDGMGGLADGRVPSQRDLSLAIGYAGEDPMRVRFWPSEAEMPALFRDVRVDAGRYLAETAGGLTMGEMLDMLGRRAEPLADLWNAWGRVRPLLLDAH
jgi:hypothetical protein